MPQKLIVPLAQASQLALVGGKALSLNTLLKNGLKTVDGFVVTTAAAGNMNDKLRQEILQAFDQLGAKYAAVRSSAVAEDSKQAAWAGQLDTFLSVNKNNLLQAIQKCQASANSQRAKAYARQKGLKPGPVAVIVQKMIKSTQSGVAFSVHPVSKNYNHIVIEAVMGLGESLVSGSTTPDNYVINKKSGQILEKNLVQSSQILSDSQIRKLSRLVAKIEKHYGFPVDVEWAYTGKELFILQSRPITNLS